MTDVLTWTVERRVELAERAELLRKELAGIDAEVARLEAAEVVFGQWAEATDGGRRRRASWSRSRSRAGPLVRAGCGWDAAGAGPDAGYGAGVPYAGVSADHGDRGRRGRAGDGQGRRDRPGPETTPGKVEPVRGQLRKLADRGWLARTGSGRYLPR